MTTVINSAAACERDDRTEELTEFELCKVIGGALRYYATPSIPIPPPRQ